MKPSSAFFPFVKLFFKDRKNLLKALLKYTSEADKRVRYIKKFGREGMPMVDFSELVANINENIVDYTCLDGTSTLADISLLMALCRKINDCEYLEIGSWRGESLVNVASVANHCTSISLSKNEMLAMGMSKRSAELQRLFTKNLKNVTHIEANSTIFDFTPLYNKFDVVFVDGDHSYEGVKNDTSIAFKLLKDENSVIVWHDCGIGYEDYRYEVIAAIMDGCPIDKQKNIYRVTNTWCGIYTNQKINTLELSSPQLPTKIFNFKIESKNYNSGIAE